MVTRCGNLADKQIQIQTQIQIQIKIQIQIQIQKQIQIQMIDFSTLWAELRRCGKLRLRCLADDAMVRLADLQIQIQIKIQTKNTNTNMNTVRTMPCLAGSTDECLSLSPLEDLLRPVFDYHLLPNLVFFPFLPLPHHRRSIWGPAGHICIKCLPYFFLGPTADSLLEVVDYNTVGFRLASSAVKPLCFQTFWCGVLAWLIDIQCANADERVWQI